jgi:kumamolisin
MTMKKNGTAQRVSLPTSEHRIPVGSKAIRHTTGSKWIELTIGVKPVKPLPDLSALDNKLPAERKYMTREQLAREYGSDPKAVHAIENFAKEHCLVVTRNESASARMASGRHRRQHQRRLWRHADGL